MAWVRPGEGTAFVMRALTMARQQRRGGGLGAVAALDLVGQEREVRRFHPHRVLDDAAIVLAGDAGGPSRTAVAALPMTGQRPCLGDRAVGPVIGGDVGEHHRRHRAVGVPPGLLQTVAVVGGGGRRGEGTRVGRADHGVDEFAGRLRVAAVERGAVRGGAGPHVGNPVLRIGVAPGLSAHGRDDLLTRGG